MTSLSVSRDVLKPVIHRAVVACLLSSTLGMNVNWHIISTLVDDDSDS